MLRKISLQVLLISLFIVLSTSQLGSVSAGINVGTSDGPEGGTSKARVIEPAKPVAFYAEASGSGVFKSTNGSATGLTATLTSRWSTFFGGHGHTNGVQSRVDSSGNVWVVFATTAADMPTTVNAIDPTPNGNEDIVLAKFSAEGDLLYSTYFGGADVDVVSSIALDNDDHIYVTGHTYSANFPTTANALSRMLQGGRDAIVVKLDAAGQLVYSTLLGGSSWDYGFTMAVDAQHDIYVGGFTHGSFPVTAGVAQFNFGGAGDGFVAKLQATPVSTTLVFATYLGGYSWEAVSALAVDENGYMYLALGTHSTDFPTTPGAFDRVCNNCATNIKTDGAIVKLNPDASQLVYSTLFGSNTATTSSMGFSGIAIDAAGNAVVVGQTTYTADLPMTPDAFQPTYGGGNYDGLLVKINALGSQLLYSTYFGGSGDDRVSNYDTLARDEQGNLYFAGRTASTNLPLLNPIQSSLGGGYDAYLASFDAENHLRLSTYWGGSQDEGDPNVINMDVTVDTQGNVYLVGGTISSDFPTTPNAFDPTINGTDYNGFVTKFTTGNIALGTWHVAKNGSDVTGSGAEASPFATIQHGIARAANGDTVLVHPGVYRENINFNGKNIAVGSLFVTTSDEDYLLQTVIDGNRTNHVVTFSSGETAAARLSGLTITNGYAHDASMPNGGGIVCNNSSPTLDHLKISGNEAVQQGGGLYFDNCSSNLRAVMIVNNLAAAGGGIRYTYGSVSLENVVVAHNSARSDGAGIQFYHANGTIKNALIADNSGGAKGGGLMFDGCSPTFINVTVVGNWTVGHGGGLNVSYMSQPTLVNSIVWGNSPEQIYYDTQWPGEAITIEYSDVQDGAAGIVTNGHGPVNWGDGNLVASPRFVNEGLGNYRLADDSPAINAGNASDAPLTDIEGNPRPYPTGSNPDMGAYENPSGLTVLSSKVYLPIIFSQDAAPVTIIPGSALQFPRTRHTATRLLDGKILIVGGSWASDDHLAEVELFDPATGVSSQVAALHTPRHQHTATLLPDGRVLVVGGYSLPQQWLSDAEVYDPATDTWTIVSPPHKHGVEHTATLLKDGRVLVVGGCIGSSLCTDRVDIFNPQTNAWTEALPLPSDRASHTAQLLNDGRVLIAGGGRGIDNVPLGGDALLYDPQMNTWAPTGPMVTMRLQAQAVGLADGRVLVTGGLDTENPSNPTLSASTEIYDPASNTWTSTAPLSQIRYQNNLVRLEDGKVLAIGGVRDPEHAWTASSFVREIESYDPLTNWWSISGNLLEPRASATATVLPDGRVWVTGGRYLGTYWSSTWLIDASTP